MSLPATTTITCPTCKKDFPITYWQTVNVTLDPHLRRRVIAGSICRHTCPHCARVTDVRTPMLYHDVARRFMISLILELPGEPPPTVHTKSLETTSRLLAEYQFRFVLSWDELVEKINIFENGWDDRIIEMLKLFVIERLFPFGSPEFKESTARLTGLRDDGAEWPAFEFEIWRRDTSVGVGTAPSELYDKMAQSLEDRFGKNYRCGEWQIVNKAAILNEER